LSLLAIFELSSLPRSRIVGYFQPSLAGLVRFLGTTQD
jgi:hypothetical protein